MRTCPMCGASFEPITNNAKYCSKECSRKAQYERTRVYLKKRAAGEFVAERVCKACGRRFIHAKHGRTVYCSDECATLCKNDSKHGRKYRRIDFGERNIGVNREIADRRAFLAETAEAARAERIERNRRLAERDMAYEARFGRDERVIDGATSTRIVRGRVPGGGSARTAVANFGY